MFVLSRNLVLPVVALALTCVALPHPGRGETAIPSPESVLGEKVGADFFLASYGESMAYFEALAEASDRVRLVSIGKTSFGRDWKIAIISAPENLDNLEELRAISQRLAHPRGLDDEGARQLARTGKAIVHIDAGLHATEVAHAQHTLELAHLLAKEEEDPEILAILDRVVLLLWPSLNPDGQDMVVDWYRSNLGTPFEVAPMVRLYQKYIGHDNNRDGYMLNTLESRVSTRVIRHWEPQLLYNHHQTAPFPARIWIPPFAEPISPHVHPLMWRTVNLVGMAMAQALEERGQEGAVHMGTGFDNWYPGFIDHANNFHNVASFLTETGLYKYATPHFYELSDFPAKERSLRPRSLYASPWKGGWWRLGDAVSYMLTASVSVLDVAAKFKEDLLYNRYQASRDVIQLYQEEPPYAYFIPTDQRDPVAAVELLRRLAYNGIEISRVKERLRVDGQDYPAGTWVIPMDQPFAHFVRQLFAIQSYPDLREYPEGPPDQPYDVAGWTLPLQMGVRVVEATSPLDDEVRARLEPVRAEPLDPSSEVADAATFDSPLGIGFDSHPVATAIRPPTGKLSGTGSMIALSGAENNAYRFLNAAWEAGAEVSFDWGSAPESEAKSGTPGRFLVRGLANASQLAERLAVRADRTSTTGTKLTRPRIGLYRPWRPSMDEGWTRWLLERYDFQFENLYDADMRAGELRRRFDVVLLADMSSRQISDGYPPGTVPARFAGGLGRTGTRALDAFVRQGGTLVTLNQSSHFAIEELHLPVVDSSAGMERTEFFLGGSIVEMEVDSSHPVMTGMPERPMVFVSQSPVFAAKEGFVGRVLARYPASGSPLVSGYLLGEEHLRGKAAAVEVRHGSGRVLLFGLKPQWRGQPFGSFRILFNALLDVRPDEPEDQEGWDLELVPVEVDGEEDQDKVSQGR